MFEALGLSVRELIALVGMMVPSLLEFLLWHGPLCLKTATDIQYLQTVENCGLRIR